jgi:hypothetical protein
MIGRTDIYRSVVVQARTSWHDSTVPIVRYSSTVDLDKSLHNNPILQFITNSSIPDEGWSVSNGSLQARHWKFVDKEWHRTGRYPSTMTADDECDSQNSLDRKDRRVLNMMVNNTELCSFIRLLLAALPSQYVIALMRWRIDLRSATCDIIYSR